MNGLGSAAIGVGTLSSAFGSIKQGVAYYDAADRLQFWNVAYEQFWTDRFDVRFQIGLAYEDILRQMLSAGAYPEAAGCEDAWLETRLANRSKDWHVFERRQANGRWLRLEQTRTPDGGLICVNVDITALKETSTALEEALEAANQATQAKSTFLAVMSHEIRTPLNGVLGMAQAMEAGTLTAVQRNRLSIIRQSGSVLLDILNDILDISKIEAGKLELEVAPFDLSDVVKGACAAFTGLANKNGISFGLVIEEGAKGAYIGDSTRLRQILYNLISNAVKFTEAGEVRVNVDRQDGMLVLTVSDTGIGISPEALTRLFGKFTQADASTTRRYGGSGLGLSICLDLANLMGGQLTVKSALGCGSVFRLDLPLERMERAPPALLPRAEKVRPSVAPTLPPLRILAAEDNEINCLVLRTVLDPFGVDLTVVHDGAEAIEAWRVSEYDLILMDIQMPRLDGPTATLRIRQMEADQRRARTPIIALSANAMKHQIDEYLQLGMDDFVAKPINIEDLVAAIAAACADPTHLDRPASAVVALTDAEPEAGAVEVEPRRRSVI